MPEEACEVCSKAVKTMTFQKTGVCSRRCEKKRDEE